MQQWRDQKRLLFPAAIPGISLDSWSLWLEIPASFATAYRISCWEMPRRSFFLQWLPSSLWSARRRWEMITSITTNSHESTKYCHLIEVFLEWQGVKDQKEVDVNLNIQGPEVMITACPVLSLYKYFYAFIGVFCKTLGIEMYGIKNRP